MPDEKPLAVFDIDGTIFRSSLLIEVTQELIKAGVFPESISSKYDREYAQWLDRRGSYEIYLQKLVEAFKERLIGTGVTQLEEAAEKVIASSAHRTYRYTRDLITQLRKTHFLVAISGSPDELVSRFAKFYGFDAYRATSYGRVDGRYDGTNVRGDLKKGDRVREIVQEHGLTLSGSVGVGDTESDADFLQLVERPIAFNPNSVLFEIAMKRGWQVVVERKDVIYYYNKADE
jgi:HAD superfamily hydrolase (TIGR01490 family)